MDLNKVKVSVCDIGRVFRAWLIRFMVAGVIVVLMGFVARKVYVYFYATSKHASWAVSVCLNGDVYHNRVMFPFGTIQDFSRVVCEREEGGWYSYLKDKSEVDGGYEIKCFDTVPAKVYPPGWSCQIGRGDKAEAVDVYLYWQSTYVWLQ